MATPSRATRSTPVPLVASRHRILVVDDSSTVRSQIVESLRDYADCVEAADGQAGLEQVRALRPDAVVADLEMPVMDGVEFLRALRAEPAYQQTPVIIITAVTAIETVNQCRALGCAGFVLKPVDRDYLLAKLRRVLRD